MTEPRQTNCIVVIGYNGTGKTTVVSSLLAKMLSQGNRILIVTPDDREYNSVPYLDIENHPNLLQTFKGITKTIFLEKFTIQAIRDHFTNGVVVFEDCRAYFGSVTDQELHSLLIRRRQMMIDIVAVAHGFTEVPRKFFTFSSHIVLFHTKDNIKARKDVLRNFDKMQHEQIQVNVESLKNPHYYKIIRQ
jgi:molybdopterin-guanine dinucleotide biosynthesis protein